MNVQIAASQPKQSGQVLTGGREQHHATHEQQRTRASWGPCVEHCVVAFSREIDQFVRAGRTLHCSPDFLECCLDEKLLQATYGPVGARWGHWTKGCSPSLSSMTCDREMLRGHLVKHFLFES